jgi:hypothetical protein
MMSMSQSPKKTSKESDVSYGSRPATRRTPLTAKTWRSKRCCAFEPRGAGKSKAFGVVGGVFANLPKQELHAVNFLVKPDSSIVLWDYQLEAFYETSKEDQVWWAII